MYQNSSFNERIIVARREKNWGQYDLAKAVGVSRRTVSRWENQNIAPKNIVTRKKLAKALDMSLDDLYKGE